MRHLQIDRRDHARRARPRSRPSIDLDEAARTDDLYRQHYARVLAYALRRVGPDRAQDVVAETFLVAWRHIRKAPADPLASTDGSVPAGAVVASLRHPESPAPGRAGRGRRIQ
jgi:Sigma-70 region 2